MGSLTSFEPARRGVGRAAARCGGLVPPAVQGEDTCSLFSLLSWKMSLFIHRLGREAGLSSQLLTLFGSHPWDSCDGPAERRRLPLPLLR